MVVYLVAALEALAYLSAVPVCAAFCLDSENGLRAGAGVGAFGAGGALRRARRAMDRARRRGRARVGLRRGLGFLRRLRPRAFRLRGRVALGDAAATALACGALISLGEALRGRIQSAEVDVVPAFDGEFSLELRGMICATAGQIMVAAITSGIDQSHGRTAHGKASD